jgi:beta-lactamase class D
MKLSIVFIFISFVLMQACNQKKQDVKLNTDSSRTKKEGSFKSMDFKKYFDSSGVKGSIVVYDLNADKYFYYDSARCGKQFTPASTFKIPNSIIGLETGVIADENFVIKWDGVKRQHEEWNADLDLKTAIKLSAVPYYQELARRVGEDKMKELVTKLNYGNMDISGGVDKFWLNGHLKISQFQQIDFLKKLYKGELPVSKRSMDITKNIILNEDTLGYKLRAKTGTNDIENLNIGWWVGWVEKEGNAYFFATNIEAKDLNDNFYEARKLITRKVLQELGILP